MASLARGQTSNCANPVLDIFTQVNGVLTDLFSLEFQIFDVTSGVPVQVFPVAVGTREVVNVGALCPVGGKLGTGHYVGTWTVPMGENLGNHQIKWFFKLTSSSVEQIFIEEFEVLLVAASSTAGYALVQDLRNEGVTVAQASDARLQYLIGVWSRFIDRATNQWFEPRQRVVLLDGSDTRTLFLDAPIVGITSIKMNESLVDSTSYKVYNRHLSQGLTAPDDRNNPKVEFAEASRLDRYATNVWARGSQNIEVAGVFGYTDVPAGSSSATEGVTPDLIKRACMLLVIRDLTPLGSVEDRQAALATSRLIEERTRDQSYRLGRGRIDTIGTAGGATPWTDDPEINTILDMYRAPPVVRTTGPRI